VFRKDKIDFTRTQENTKIGIVEFYIFEDAVEYAILDVKVLLPQRSNTFPKPHASIHIPKK
jgi:hypothetical protein